MKQTLQTLDGAQARQLLQTFKGHPQEALFVLALTTGMRQGELLGLQWQDIDAQNQLLFVRRTRALSLEGGQEVRKSERFIALAQCALPALLSHRMRQDEARAQAGTAWNTQGYVFCQPDGSPFSPGYEVQRIFRACLQEAGLPNVLFHSLRYGLTKYLLHEGVSPLVVQSILGLTVEHFPLAPLTLALQREAMEKVTLLFEGPGEEKESRGEV